MADTFSLVGSWSSNPATGNPSAYPGFNAPISERKTLELKLFQAIELTSNPAVSVSFGTLTEAHVLIIATTAKVVATITSSDGATQTIPVENLLILINDSVPVTALSIQRFAGQDTTANIFLGQQAD